MHSTGTRLAHATLFSIVIFLTSAVPAGAQGPASSSQRTGWVFEIHVGSILDSAPGKVLVSQLPSPGPTFTTPEGNASRRVPSWYFGDGTVLANAVADRLGGISHLVGLDPALTAAAVTRQSGADFGMRIGHTITNRVLVLFSLDRSSARAVLTDSAKAAYAATSGSYGRYWNAWLTSPNVGNIKTSSTVTTTENTGTETILSVAADIRVMTIRGWTPYIAVGAGVALPLQPVDTTVTLLGHYEATLVRPGAANNGARVSETDQVQVRHEVMPTGIGILGAGVERDLSRHVGIRAEIRSFLNINQVRTRIDTLPLAAPGTPPFVNFRGGVNPDLQVSTTSSPTSLSLQGVDHFDSFSATGSLPTLSVGMFFRF